MSFVGCEHWQLRYQRNNKQSGLKNIRCFPACSNPHRLRGFCGNSIVFKPSKSLSPLTISFGEFALKDSVTLRVGELINQDTIDANERVEDLFKPWHRGEGAGNNSIEFNKQKKGWHYSWQANKHTSDSEHVFRVYLLEKAAAQAQTLYRCIGVYDSPAFTIFCRRRDKSGVERLPPQFASQIRSSESEGSEDEEDDEETEEASPKPKKRAAVKLSDRRRSSTSSVQVEKKAKATQAHSHPRPAGGVISGKSSLLAEYAVVFRILAALTNVHDRQQTNQQQQTAVSAPLSASNASVSSSSPQTPSTTAEEEHDADLFDLTKVISDCWDWVSPDNMTDSQFFDSFFAQPSAKPVEEILVRLGQHLIKEDFTREIEEVFAHRQAGDDSKKQVLNCLKGKIEVFFEKEGTSLEKFDKELLAQNPQLAEDKTKNIQLLFPPPTTLAPLRTPMQLENMFRPPFRVVPGGIHDFTGHWRRPASTLETLEKLRSIIGFSWIERKLMTQMESEFFIWYEGNTMFVRGQRKLAGSNCLIHIIDGVDYPFVQPSAMLGDNTPSIGLFNRTWATEDGSMHFCTTYTVEYRTYRTTKRSPCGNKLESTITLQRNETGHLPGVWTDVYTFPVLAERVTSFLPA
jgi:hypothetical protein